MIGKCPVCGRFCGIISATVNDLDGITKVEGHCKVHGLVDLTDQEWSYEDFFPEEEA